jgi:A-macroglobulin complement component
VDFEKAIHFVRSHGNEIERARMDALLWDADPSTAVWSSLYGMQHEDGGFEYWVHGVSSICGTAYVLQWLDDLALHRTSMANAACDFLLDRQKDDGGWDEVDSVLHLDPPEWMMPGRIDTRVWLTAFCVWILIRFGHAEAPGSRCPADFLLKYSDDTGRLQGYFRATWIALPLFAFFPGAESDIFKRALRVVETHYSPDWSSAYLA